MHYIYYLTISLSDYNLVFRYKDKYNIIVENSYSFASITGTNAG